MNDSTPPNPSSPPPNGVSLIPDSSPMGDANRSDDRSRSSIDARAEVTKARLDSSSSDLGKTVTRSDREIPSGEETQNWDGKQSTEVIEPTNQFGYIPGYEILEELGRGGMGVVYKARQLGFNRIVASR